MLRHTFGAHLAKKGMPITHIQDLMGHEHIEITRLYVTLYNKAKKQKSKI